MTTPVDTNPYRGLLPDLPAYACTNCGHWQRWPAPGPQVCPVCADVRNALPEDGFEFVTAEQADAMVTGFCRPTAVDGVTEFGTEPRFGLDSRGWVIESDAGLVGFECAPWYTADMLAQLRRMAEAEGGFEILASSHVHGYGALWQLQDVFQPEVLAIQKEDLRMTKAMRVTWPYDEALELRPGQRLLHVGGHYEGQALLHDAHRRILFCGDAFKVDQSPEGENLAISTHKAFHKSIPLSPGEVRRYREVIAGLDFDTVCTPFEHAPGITRDIALAVLDDQLRGPPGVRHLSLKDGSLESLR